MFATQTVCNAVHVEYHRVMVKSSRRLPQSDTEHGFYLQLGRNIRSARVQSGLTQEGLASLVSLTRSSVANVEGGRQKLLAYTLTKFATVLSVCANDLLPTKKAVQPSLRNPKLMRGTP